MPWCPKCKMEYRKGVSLCADCEVELVDELQDLDDYMPFFQTEQKDLAEKLVNFFEYSDLEASIQFDEENQIYHVLVPQDQQKNAKKLYQAFYYVERERKEEAELKASTETTTEETESEEATDDFDENGIEDAYTDDQSEEDNISPANLKPYVMKADQYTELKSTVTIFLFFGIVGLIFVLLNIVGILNILYGPLPNTVMGALFLFFIYIGLSSHKKAKKIQSEIDEENKLTDNINNWLKINITENYLSSIHNDSISDELNYFHKTAEIKKLVVKEFGQQNPSYLDRVIDEYYNNIIDS